MADQQGLAAALIDFVRRLADGDELEEVLQQLGEHVLDVVPAAGAGISLADARGQLHVVTATDARSQRLEAVQDDLHEGPSRDAYETRNPVVPSDLHQARRWPRFQDSALAAGVHAAAGLPLATGDSCVGALSLYRSEAHAFTEDEVAAARVLADMATVHVVNVRDLERARRMTHQLQHALDSRIPIEQAKGYLAAQLATDVDDAFHRLRRHARNHNRTLRDVAGDLLRGEIGPGQFR